MKRIQAPEGVAALMWELWEKHQRGETPDRGNVFLVDLPPLSDEERKKLNPVDTLYADIDAADDGCPI